MEPTEINRIRPMSVEARPHLSVTRSRFLKRELSQAEAELREATVRVIELEKLVSERSGSGNKTEVRVRVRTDYEHYGQVKRYYEW